MQRGYVGKRAGQYLEKKLLSKIFDCLVGPAFPGSDNEPHLTKPKTKKVRGTGGNTELGRGNGGGGKKRTQTSNRLRTNMVPFTYVGFLVVG